MIRNADHLALFIKDALKSRRTCRIYQDALDSCWFFPSLDGRKAQSEHIHAFARTHGWSVQLHTPGGYGLVADFEADGVR